jgi:hypothetical protein
MSHHLSLNTHTIKISVLIIIIHIVIIIGCITGKLQTLIGVTLMVFLSDTGMALFILYTTCAMILRWVPGLKVVRRVFTK